MDTVDKNDLQNNQNVSPKQNARSDSYFDGNTWQLIGYRILSAFVNTITLGIAYPWMLCMVQRWEVKHTVIHGRRLKFNGHGHQLIGKYLLWVFLTIITFGIYGIWLGLGMKKWVIKHTVYADEERPVDSYFSGGAGGYLGIHILSLILTLFTFGIGKAWADKMVLKWEARHTHIGGSPLEFNGTGGQLFVKYLLLVLLTPLTLGIYALFFTVIYMRWQVKHTEAVYQTPEIQAKAKAHEMTAVQDFAKYRIAANDQEIAAMKSGYTGKEDLATLEQMVEDGNPFAAYHLAMQLKGENALYEDKALELLQKAADGKVHSALLDLAKQVPAEQKVSMLTESAQYGNAEASWLLATEYKNTNNLPQAVYWFKVAMEWDVANAKASADKYDELVKNIALQLSENRVMSEPSKRKISPVVWCGVAVVGILLLVGIFFSIMFASAVNDPSRSFMGSCIIRVSSDSMAPEFKTGDVIYLDDDISNVLIGDIIAFVYDEYGTIAVHRVHDIVTNDDGEIRYITKGDNNISQDANPVHPGNVIGVYKHKATFIGEILGSFQGIAAIDAVGITTFDWETPLEGDGSKSSPYLIKNAYDFQKYVFYLGDNYGTITEDFEIYASHLYYGNNESNAKFFEKQVERGYLRFQNGDIKVTYKGVEIVCENRINISDMPQTDTLSDNNTVETPSTAITPEVNLIDNIVGGWVMYNRYAHPAMGEDTLEIYRYVFDATGSYTFTHKECMAVEQGRGSLYYDGTHWMIPLASEDDGTYELINTSGGVCLSMRSNYSTDPDDPAYSFSECTIHLDGDILTMQGDGWSRTLTRE